MPHPTATHQTLATTAVHHYPGIGSWSVEPIPLIVLLGFSAAYIYAYRRARRHSEKVGLSYLIPYFTGILLIALALFSPIDPIGDRYLLSVHMVQHLLLQDIAPAFLILGLRSPLLPLGLPKAVLRAIAPGGRFGKVRNLLTNPWFALGLWAAVTWGWNWPAAFDYSASHPLVHDLEHITLFYAGLTLWWVVIDPLPSGRLRPNGFRLAILGASRLASAGVCIPLTWLPRVEYPLYASAPRAYGLSALSDQALAGAAMCFTEFLVFGIAFVAVFISVLNRSDAVDRLGELAAGSR
jgi:putative membrane protein